MRKWVSILLTVMMLVNSLLTPVVALADDAVLSTGYARGVKDVGIYNDEFTLFGWVHRDETIYIDSLSGEWAYVAFAVEGEVVTGYAYTASGNLYNVYDEQGGATTYNGHELGNVTFKLRDFEAEAAQTT